MLCGLSGCLLFTDPINEAPKVKIQGSGDVVPGSDQPVNYFVSELSDDRTSPSQITLDWGRFDVKDEGCGWVEVDPSAWPSNPTITRLDREVPYPFTTNSTDLSCLCVRATDLDGAVGQDCVRIAPVAPLVSIIDSAGVASGAPRPLCSVVHLSAHVGGKFGQTDDVQYNWTFSYEGSDPRGSNLALANCSGSTTPAGPEQCFSAKGPGTYKVSLIIVDTPAAYRPDAGSGSRVLRTDKALYDVVIDPDHPPCLQRTDPDVYAQLIQLSHFSYDSRDFTVLSAADDCEPFPAPAVAPSQGAQFWWSVYDTTLASPAWVYPANSGNTFTVSQASYPNARFGDSIKVRVEVRDSAVQSHYISPCSPDRDDICCDKGACTGVNDCVRWTTWTVQFVP